MFYDYLESVDFLKHKFNLLNRRAIILYFDEKIKSKEGTNQKKRNSYKKHINKRLLDIKRKAFRRNIYVRISYYYNDNNPPTTVNATKNLLDLMHVKINQQNLRENLGIKRNRLPYYDDSQISFLSVRQHINSVSAHAYIFIENYNNILQYSNILSKLEEKRILDSNDQDDEIDFWDPINYPIESLGYKIEMFQRQKAILKANQIQPFYFELLFNHDKYKERNSSFLDILLTILKYPIRVVVRIPKNNNEIADQKKIFKKKLSEFKKQYTLFKSLYGPVILSVFYRPKNGINIKDIDNYLREIVSPCFEAEFNPPTRIFNPTREELAAIQRSDYCSNLNGHIIGYDIIKLPIDDNPYRNEEICIIGFHMENHSDAIGLLKDNISEIFNSI